MVSKALKEGSEAPQHAEILRFVLVNIDDQ